MGEMKYGGAGLPSLDGAQDKTWYFPLAALKPWTETEDAKTPPVPGRAFRAAGLPTHTRVDIGPPGRHDLPWEFKVRVRNLMDPVAPPLNERVDLEATKNPLPPMMKVKQIVDVECMDKLHKDPLHLCKPEAYVDYNMVSTTKAPPKNITEAEAKVLRQKIKHLKKAIKALSPTEPPEDPHKMVFKAPGMMTDKATMNTAVRNSNKYA